MLVFRETGAAVRTAVKSFLVVTLLLLLLGPASADLYWEHITDADWTTSDIVFVAEGRFGDRAGAAEKELNIGAETDVPVQSAHYDWPNGVPEPFTVTYDSGTGLASFTVGGVTLNYTPVGSFTEAYVRTRAVEDDTSMLVDNLWLNGLEVGEAASISGPNGTDVLRIWIPGVTLSDGFTLTGQSTMTWTGDPGALRSKLAYQIKLGTPIPEPGILALAGVGLVAALLRRKRR